MDMETVIIVFFSFLLPLGIFPLVFILTKRHNDRTAEEMRACAISLGLDFIVPNAQAPEEGYPDIRSGLLPQTVSPPPAVRKLLSFLSSFSQSWRLEGKKDGIKVEIRPEVRSSGKSSTTYTVVKAFFKPLPFGLSIGTENFFTKLGHSLNIHDIETGDAEFDSQVRVKSKDAMGAQTLLADSGIRAAISGVLAKYPFVSVSESCVTWEKQGVVTKPETYAEILSSIVPCAKAFDR